MNCNSIVPESIPFGYSSLLFRFVTVLASGTRGRFVVDIAAQRTILEVALGIIDRSNGHRGPADNGGAEHIRR